LNKEINKKIAFLFLYGHETKTFLRSGLYNFFANNLEAICLKRDFKSNFFNEYKKEYNLDVHILDKNLFLKERPFTEKLLISSRKSRRRIKKIGNYYHFSTDKKASLKDYVVGNFFSYHLINNFYKKFIKKKYFNKQLASYFIKNKITDLIIPDYSSIESIILSLTAKKIGIKTWLIVNSWKDFYVNDLILSDVNGIFVWNKKMKEQIQDANNISSSQICISGNPYFDIFYNYKPFYSKNYYNTKYNINNRPIILYTMMSPYSYKNEIEIIKYISEMLNELFKNINNRPKIIVRKNPMDERKLSNFELDENIIFAEDYFEKYDKNENFFIQRIEGEKEWLDLLYYADININVASTVTLESLLMNTPVINIEFNEYGKQDEYLSRFSQTDFYKPLLNNNGVFLAKNREIFKQQLINVLKNKPKIDTLEQIIGNFGNIKSIIIEKILKGI